MSPGEAHETVYESNAAAQAGHVAAHAAIEPTAEGHPEQAPPSDVAVVSTAYFCEHAPSELPGLGGGGGCGGGGDGQGGDGRGGRGGGGPGGCGGGGGQGYSVPDVTVLNDAFATASSKAQAAPLSSETTMPTSVLNTLPTPRPQLTPMPPYAALMSSSASSTCAAPVPSSTESSAVLVLTAVTLALTMRTSIERHCSPLEHGTLRSWVATCTGSGKGTPSAFSPIQLTGNSTVLPRNEVTQPATPTSEPTVGIKGAPPAGPVGTVGTALDACESSRITSMPE